MINITQFGRIEVSRGDSFKVPLFINQGNRQSYKRYALKSTDTIYFAVMEPNQSFENAIIKFVYTSADAATENGDLYIKFQSKDTENLLPGKYFYTVKMVSTVLGSDAEVCTIIPETEFYIMR